MLAAVVRVMSALPLEVDKGCYCSVWSCERIEPWISCCSSHKLFWGLPSSHFPVWHWTQRLGIQSRVHFLSKITPIPAHPSATLGPNLLAYHDLGKYNAVLLKYTSVQACRCLCLSGVNLLVVAYSPQNKNKAPTTPTNSSNRTITAPSGAVVLSLQCAYVTDLNVKGFAWFVQLESASERSYWFSGSREIACRFKPRPPSYLGSSSAHTHTEQHCFAALLHQTKKRK